jgi:carboxymethylenebutenolidase
VHEIEQVISASAGAMRTFCVYPERGGPHPLAILSPDGPGYREELFDNARRFATAGYCVVVPDWTYRFGAPVDLSDAHVAGTELMRRIGIMLADPKASLLPDAQALIEHIAKSGFADTRRVVAVGYCWGASCVVHLLAEMSDRIVAGAGLHPFWLGPNNTPLPRHLHGAPENAVGAAWVPPDLLAQVQKIKGELHFGAADPDYWISRQEYLAFGKALQDAKVRGEVEFYPGALHGFAVKGQNFNKPARERHFERVLDLWQRNLSGG